MVLEALHRLVLKITAVGGTPMSMLCLVMFIWGGRFLTLLYGRQYAGNRLIVAILALNLLVTATTFPLSRALFAVDRAHVDFLVNFTALFIMLTLGLWMVRAFGPLGAAVGLLLANFVTSAVRVGIFLKLPNELPRSQACD
jgi:O-antigen/teichoic acid export membrane protein